MLFRENIWYVQMIEYDTFGARLILSAQMRWVKKQVFHLITVISYLEDPKHCTIPAEICLIRFSLGKGGIMRTRTWHVALGIPEFSLFLWLRQEARAASFLVLICL